MDNRTKAELDHWLTTPPEPPDEELEEVEGEYIDFEQVNIPVEELTPEEQDGEDNPKR